MAVVCVRLAIPLCSFVCERVCVRMREGERIGEVLSIVDIQFALCVHMLSDVYALMLVCACWSTHACRVYARAGAY